MEKAREDKKEHILDVAEKIFAELGYEGASTRHLANEAGVNMAMLNYYFGSKDGLLKAVLERRFSGTRQILNEVKEQNISSWEKLLLAFDFYLNKITSNNNFHRMIHREISLSQRSEMSDFISDNTFRNLSVFREIIEEGIADKTFRKVDVEMLIASIVGTMYYLINSNQVTKRLMNMDLQDRDTMQNEVKPRIKKFIHNYLSEYLLVENEK
jgi:AcrR family transcriptional regulator